MVVPSRGRPETLPRTVGAWNLTRGFAYAALVFVVDADDPTLPGYTACRLPERAHLIVEPQWQPMVVKLNSTAHTLTTGNHHPALPYSGYAIGFCGDDHIPRTAGWARHFLSALRALGTGVVYGDDLIQSAALPTHWAMTADIVRELGRMVPAPVGHYWSDNAVADVARAAECLQYLPAVVIEHLHPTAGTAPWDPTYAATLTPEQETADHHAYLTWRDADTGLPADAATLRRLRGAQV